MMLVNVNGTIVPPEEATVSVLDHGFLFGDSVYDVVRTIGATGIDAPGRLHAGREHLERLHRSASRIGLDLPLPIDGIRAEAVRTHRARLAQLAEAGQCTPEVADSYLRVIVTRGTNLETISLDPATATTPNWFIIAKGLPDWGADAYSRGIRVAIVDVLRTSPKALDPQIKSGNYLNNVLALAEAKRRGAMEGIFCNAKGHVTEGTTSNVFIIRDGRLLTPELGAGLLEGVTRRMVLRLAGELGIEAQECSLTPAEVLRADEAFISSATRGILPVRQIDDQSIGEAAPGPITARLMTRFDEAAWEEAEEI